MAGRVVEMPLLKRDKFVPYLRFRAVSSCSGYYAKTCSKSMHVQGGVSIPIARKCVNEGLPIFWLLLSSITSIKVIPAYVPSCT